MLRFIFCLLFFSHTVFAGGGADSLKLAMENKKLKDSSQIGQEIIALKKNIFQNPDSVYNLAFHLSKYSKQMGFQRGVADLHIIMASVWGFRGNYDKSTEFYSRAFEIYERLKDKNGISRAYMGMGNAFLAQENYRKAIEIYNSSLQLAKEVNNPQTIITNYLTIINCYNQLEEIKMSSEYLKEAEMYMSTHKTEEKYTDFLDINRAFVFGKTGRHKEAIDILTRVEEKAIQKGEHSIVMEISLQKGVIFLDINDFNQAYYYLKKFEELSHQLNSTFYKNKALKELMRFFEKKKDYTNAYKYARRYADAQDSMHKSINKAAFYQFESNFEFERKNKEVSGLKNENVSQGAALKKIETSNFVLIFMVGFMIVFTALSTYLFIKSYGNLQKIRKQNQKINQQKMSLENYSVQLEQANRDIALKKELLEERNRNILMMNDNLEEVVAIRTRDLETKNEQITRYAYYNAHKLRAPIATIKGLVKVFKMVEAQAEKELIISKITETSENLDKIIHEIQDIIGERHEDDNFVIKE